MGMVIKVEEIIGKCPQVCKGGEKIVIEECEIILEEMNRICIHALAPILHYAVALRGGLTLGLDWLRKERVGGNSKLISQHCSDFISPLCLEPARLLSIVFMTAQISESYR